MSFSYHFYDICVLEIDKRRSPKRFFQNSQKERNMEINFCEAPCLREVIECSACFFTCKDEFLFVFRSAAHSPASACVLWLAQLESEPFVFSSHFARLTSWSWTPHFSTSTALLLQSGTIISRARSVSCERNCPIWPDASHSVRWRVFPKDAIRSGSVLGVGRKGSMQRG